MLRFTDEQRALLGDKLGDLAQIAVGALSLGQFLSEREFSMPIMTGGIALWLMFMGMALWLGKTKR